MNYLYLLFVMTKKEILVQHKRTILGFSWVIISPFLQSLVIALVLTNFIEIKNYFLFLVTGFLPWIFFSSSLSRATQSFVSERSLIHKAAFPREVLPISMVLSKLLNLVVNSTLVLFYVATVSGFTSGRLLIYFAGLFWIFIYTVGLSMLLSTLNARYRDVAFIIQPILMSIFYLTPVIYPLSMIPNNLFFLFALNPLSTIIEMFHWAILGNGTFNREILLVNALTTIFILLIGFLIFSRNKKDLADLV